MMGVILFVCGALLVGMLAALASEFLLGMIDYYRDHW